jgi:hypothetical protein
MQQTPQWHLLSSLEVRSSLPRGFSNPKLFSSSFVVLHHNLTSTPSRHGILTGEAECAAEVVRRLQEATAALVARRTTDRRLRRQMRRDVDALHGTVAARNSDADTHRDRSTASAPPWSCRQGPLCLKDVISSKDLDPYH